MAVLVLVVGGVVVVVMVVVVVVVVVGMKAVVVYWGCEHVEHVGIAEDVVATNCRGGKECCDYLAAGKLVRGIIAFRHEGSQKGRSGRCLGVRLDSGIEEGEGAGLALAGRSPGPNTLKQSAN